MFAAPVDLRVSDAERESVADFLKRHYELGRLTAPELDERVDAAYRARVQSELRALVADLPRLDTPAPPTPRRTPVLRRLAIAAVAVLALVVVLDVVPTGLGILFVGLALTTTLLVAVMLAPFALVALAVAWLVRVLRGPRPMGHAGPPRRVF